jgi:hypothetical protein
MPESRMRNLGYQTILTPPHARIFESFVISGAS